MEISEGARNILNIVAVGTARTLSTSIMDTAVIQKSGLPEEEVRSYLGQLEGLGYISICIKMSGADYRLINMTKEGLQASSENQALR
jgi:hypothetical protein